MPCVPLECVAILRGEIGFSGLFVDLKLLLGPVVGHGSQDRTSLALPVEDIAGETQQ
jgi:hypothetical protein